MKESQGTRLTGGPQVYALSKTQKSKIAKIIKVDASEIEIMVITELTHPVGILSKDYKLLGHITIAQAFKI